MSDLNGPPASGTIERLVADAVDSGAVALAHRRDGKLAGVDLDGFDKWAGEYRAALLAEVERLKGEATTLADLMARLGFVPSAPIADLRAAVEDELTERAEIAASRIRLMQERDAAEERLSSLHGAPLTVGAALADPRVRDEYAIVELRGREKWHQVRPAGHHFEARTWVDDGTTRDWSHWRSYTLDAWDIAIPCRLVPLADSDADPATRGDL